MWWWAEVSAGGTRSSATVIFAVRARHFGQKAAPNRSVCVQDPCCNPPAAAGHSGDFAQAAATSTRYRTTMVLGPGALGRRHR